MDFPKRIKQHKSESDSLAILMYHLRDLGIFRGAAANDYGIDLEIEFTDGDRVIGKYLKVQVKSAEEINIRKDKVATVGGIKQSTLLYWTELSFRTHVMVFAVDLKTEKIFYTESVFWQATCQIDNSETTKTIEFLKPIAVGEEVVKDYSEKVKEKFGHFLATKHIRQIAFGSSISDIIYAHKLILRNIQLVYELYTDAWHYDHGSELHSPDVFKTVLECSQILIDLPKEIPGFDKKDRNGMFSFDYWARKSGWDEVTYYIAQKPLKIIMPLLINRIAHYNELVLKGAYYWMHKDQSYLKMVHGTIIPEARDHENLIHINYDQINFENTESFQGFLLELGRKHGL